MMEGRSILEGDRDEWVDPIIYCAMNNEEGDWARSARPRTETERHRRRIAIRRATIARVHMEIQEGLR